MNHRARIDYSRRREAEELEAGVVATEVNVANEHFAMAERYADLMVALKKRETRMA